MQVLVKSNPGMDRQHTFSRSFWGLLSRKPAFQPVFKSRPRLNWWRGPEIGSCWGLYYCLHGVSMLNGVAEYERHGCFCYYNCDYDDHVDDNIINVIDGWCQLRIKGFVGGMSRGVLIGGWPGQSVPHFGLILSASMQILS